GLAGNWIRIEHALADDSQLPGDRSLVLVNSAAAFRDEDFSPWKKGDGPRLPETRHDHDAKIAMLGARRLNQEGAIGKGRVRPIDRCCADVALGGRNLRVDALGANGTASRSLTCRRARHSLLSLLRIEGDRNCAECDDGRCHPRLLQSWIHAENLTSVARSVRRLR